MCLWLGLKTRSLTGQPIGVNVCESKGLDLLKYFSSSTIVVAFLRVFPGIVRHEVHLA